MPKLPHNLDAERAVLGTILLDNDVITLYRDQGKYAEAEPFFKRSLAILEKTLGPEHPNEAKALENYAKLLRKANREAEAAKLEARAKAIRDKHAQENLQ